EVRAELEVVLEVKAVEMVVGPEERGVAGAGIAADDAQQERGPLVAAQPDVGVDERIGGVAGREREVDGAGQGGIAAIGAELAAHLQVMPAVLLRDLTLEVPEVGSGIPVAPAPEAG